MPSPRRKGSRPPSPGPTPAQGIRGLIHPSTNCGARPYTGRAPHVYGCGSGDPASPHPCVKLSTGLCVALPQLARNAHLGPSSRPSPPGTGHFSWSHRVLGTDRPIHPHGGRAPPSNLVNNRCTRFSPPCGQPCAQSFCPGSRLLHPGPKKFFRIIYGVIHRTTPKTVDNPVDNLWTSAICLWVTQGPPVDKLLGHRITKPRSAVDNPGEICG